MHSIAAIDSNILIYIYIYIYRGQQHCEMQKMQEAHRKQLVDFNTEWDTYLEEYDTMAQGYVKEFTERYVGRKTATCCK